MLIIWLDLRDCLRLVTYIIDNTLLGFFFDLDFFDGSWKTDLIYSLVELRFLRLTELSKTFWSLGLTSRLK